MSSQVFIGMITIVVIAVIALFGFSLLKSTTSSIEDIKLIDFADKLKNDIEQTSTLKAVKYFNYEVPAIVDKVIIIDSGNKDGVLNQNYIKTNPIIVDSIKSGEGRDLFFMDSQDNIINSFDIGDISVGQFGDKKCSGVALIDIQGSMLELRLANKGNGKIFIGEDCKGLKYSVFRGPFNDNIFEYTNRINSIERTQNDRRIILKRNNDGSFFKNGTGLSNRFTIDGDLDRLFFDGFVPDNSHIKFQIKFKNEYIGPDLTKDTFYTYSGQYITLPPEFNNKYVKVKFILISNEEQTKTPYLDMIRLSYYE